MLSRKGNPSMDNLAAMFDALRQELGVGIEVGCVRGRGRGSAAAAASGTSGQLY
jgi:hypothetical protein